MKKMLCACLTAAFAWGFFLSASAWTYENGIVTAGD